MANSVGLSKTKLLDHFTKYGFFEKRLFSKLLNPYCEEKLLSIPIFCYHSQFMDGSDYTSNDHIALKDDLSILKDNGYEPLSLESAIQIVKEGQIQRDSKYFCITFVDGSPYDFMSQKDGYKIYDSFHEILGNSDLFNSSSKATSFVIVSKRARDQLFKFDVENNWFVDNECALIDIGCHSYDHIHQSVSGTDLYHCKQGRFDTIDNYSDAHIQIAMANELLRQITKNRSVPYFAFPYGQTSEYLIKDYLPKRKGIHGLKAALTTGGTCLNQETLIWKIPRFVFGYHWKNKNDFKYLLKAITFV